MSNKAQTRRNGWISGLMIMGLAFCGFASVGCDEAMLLQLAEVVASELADEDFGMGFDDFDSGSGLEDEGCFDCGSGFDDGHGFDESEFWF